MDTGEIGTVGQYVNPIVRKEDSDLVTILPQLIEEEIVLENSKMLRSAGTVLSSDWSRHQL